MHTQQQQHNNDMSNMFLSKDNRLRSGSYDMSTTKRMRTGSISGRLRTASDLEELGIIDRTQKGWLKDLIISGDEGILEALDKFEKGHQRDDIIASIKSSLTHRKDSIDLLDGLDFDFISGLNHSDDVEGVDDFNRSYGDMNTAGDWNNSSTIAGNNNNNHMHNTVTHIPSSTLSHGGNNTVPSSSSITDALNSNTLSIAPNSIALLPDPPSSSHLQHQHGSTGSSGRPPIGNKISAASTYQAKDMTSLLDDSFTSTDRNAVVTNRRASIDALMNEALFDVDLPPNVIRSHVAGGSGSVDITNGVVGDIDMDSIFNQFVAEGGDLSLLGGGHSRTSTMDLLLGSGNKNNSNGKKSIRLTMNSNNGNTEAAGGDISPDKVDLSAYASHAMSLQQQNLERKLNAAAGPGMPSSPQKTMNGNLKVKSEPNAYSSTNKGMLGSSNNSTGYGSTTGSTSSYNTKLTSSVPSTYMVKTEYSGTSHGTIKSPYLQPTTASASTGMAAPGTTLVSPYMTTTTTTNAANTTSGSTSDDYSSYYNNHHNKMLEQHGVSTIAYGTVIPEPVDVPNKLSSNGTVGSSASGDLYGYSSHMMMNNGGLNAAGMNGMVGGVMDPNNPNNPMGMTKEGTRLAGYIGAYSPEQRKLRIEKFLAKRSRRVWTRKVKYDVRKNFADSRLRIKGRFVKKEDEDIMRELLSI